jgi:uncharacterized protein YggE
MKRVLLVSLVLLGVVALAGAAGLPGGAGAQQSPSATDTLSVTGTGTVTAVSDEAQMSFGVETRRPTAQAAVAANGDDMRRVIAAVKRAGARDVTTQWVSVYPYTSSNGTVEGYVASNSVSAKSTVTEAAALIDAATEAGANQLSGPGLTSSASETLYRQALADAVGQARARAEVLAKAAGRSLGAITQISEGGAQPVPPYERATPMAASTPIEPGQLETSATVMVTFSLR